MENSVDCVSTNYRQSEKESWSIKRELIHNLALHGAPHTRYMILIWVFHPTTYFSGFKLGKLKVHTAAYDRAERVAAWSQHYSL